MKYPTSTSTRSAAKFRMPTSLNLLPMRVDVDLDGERFTDTFTWNPSDPDSEIIVFAKRTVKDLKLLPAFVMQIVQLIQAQLAEYRAYEGQDMQFGEKIVPLKLDLQVNQTVINDQFLWDLNNLDSDPEEFARQFCEDMMIEDPEVAPAIAFSIREQLYEISIQSVTIAREAKATRKGRRGLEHFSSSKTGVTSSDLMRMFANKYSVIRKRKEWDAFKPVVGASTTYQGENIDSGA